MKVVKALASVVALVGWGLLTSTLLLAAEDDFEGLPDAPVQEAAYDGADDDEDWLGLPPGTGREEVFYTCQACHSLKTVQQQGLSRDSWDETLIWMVEEQGMSEPEPDESKLLLDYLSTYYGID